MSINNKCVNDEYKNVLTDKFMKNMSLCKKNDTKTDEVVHNHFYINRKICECQDEINIVYKRIIEDISTRKVFLKRAHKLIEDSENRDDDTSNKIVQKLVDEELKSISELRLDTKSFYVFVRAYLDTVAYISHKFINRKYPKKMKPIFKSKDIEKNDLFIKELKQIINWFPVFKKDRDDILHKLGGLVIESKSEPYLIGVKRKDEELILTEMEPYFENIIRDINKLNIFLCKKLVLEK